jgi:hypothetical protein
MAANEAGMIDETIPAPHRRLDRRRKIMREKAAPAKAATEAARAAIGRSGRAWRRRKKNALGGRRKS